MTTSSRPPVANGSRAIAVGQVAGQRARDQEAGGEREQVDARPQRRVGEVVSVQRQPDALQPDDQHELQAAACHGDQQGGDAAGSEGADPEESEAEHRLGDARLDDHEGDQQYEPGRETAEHDRIGPALSRAPRTAECRG